MSAIGLGATLEINDNGGSFDPVDGITDMDVPDEVLGVAESKRLDLTGGVITKVPTVFSPGAFTFTWEFDKTQFTRLEVLRTGKTDSQFRVTLPHGSPSWTKTVPGYITSNKVNTVTADVIMNVTSTVEVSGAAV